MVVPSPVAGNAARMTAPSQRVSRESFSHCLGAVMTYAETILPEFDQEIANTRKLLACVPDDNIDWRPHPKLNTIRWNANHLVEIVGWVEGTLTQTSWDVAPPGGPAYESPTAGTRDALLELFDRNVATARQAIEQVADEALATPWSLLCAGQPIFTMPRSAVMRTFILNHLIHHRAILCMDLRMVGVSVPGMYGPSGDESSQ